MVAILVAPCAAPRTMLVASAAPELAGEFADASFVTGREVGRLLNVHLIRRPRTVEDIL